MQTGMQTIMIHGNSEGTFVQSAISVVIGGAFTLIEQTLPQGIEESAYYAKRPEEANP
jgi:hypothetical protein